MPNTDNINTLIDRLRHVDGRHVKMFDFSEVADEDAHKPIGIITDAKEMHTCNTAFCIAGWVNALDAASLNKKARIDDLLFSNDTFAADWLGLDEDRAHSLFYMEDGYMKDGVGSTSDFDELPGEIRKRAAIAVLEYLRDTGEVDWDRAIELAQKPESKPLPAVITDLLNPEKIPEGVK
jgi:hypothetical protein